MKALALLGLITACTFGFVGFTALADAIFTRIAKAFDFYRVMAEFIWHRKEFKGWLSQQKCAK